MSFLAIGGAVTGLPEMHRQAVDVSHWMTSRQFTELVAISQAAPGPNVLIVTLIGYHVAGVAGALVATFCMCGPACGVAFFIAQVFDRFKEKHWRKAIQAGLVPVSVGLDCRNRAHHHAWLRSQLPDIRHHGGNVCSDLLDEAVAALCFGRGRQ